MKSFYKRLNIIILIFFVLGIVFSAYQLYALPVLLEKQSTAVTPAIISEIRPVIWQINFVIGLTLVLGLVSLVISMYLLNFTKENERIVYVEKSEKEKKEEKEKEANKEKAFDEHALKEISDNFSQKRNLKTKCDALLSGLCNKVEASQGLFYITKKSKSKRYIELLSTYAFSLPDSEKLSYEFGEGLAGQAAKEGKTMNIQNVPEGYINIVSGLGASSPGHLMICPVKNGNEVEALVELASFKPFEKADENLIENALALVHDELNKEKGKKGSSEKEKKEQKQ